MCGGGGRTKTNLLEQKLNILKSHDITHVLQQTYHLTKIPASLTILWVGLDLVAVLWRSQPSNKSQDSKPEGSMKNPQNRDLNFVADRRWAGE
jgi:hypothetical protein